eukprot:19162-Heterococcus_DN1.PRE.2
MAGTPRYCAPEVLQNEAHGVAVDIWSFGCTFLQMVSCVVPWSGYKCTTLVALLHIVQQFRAPQLPPHLTQEMRCLLTSCLAWSPEGRPTAQELLLLYDSCSAVACPVCTHSCPQAQLTHTGGRVSSAYTDVASEFNYHQDLSSDRGGYHEELSSLAYSSSNSSEPTAEDPKAIVLSQNPYSERVRRAVSAPASGCTTSLESTSKYQFTSHPQVNGTAATAANLLLRTKASLAFQDFCRHKGVRMLGNEDITVVKKGLRADTAMYRSGLRLSVIMWTTTADAYLKICAAQMGQYVVLVSANYYVQDTRRRDLFTFDRAGQILWLLKLMITAVKLLEVNNANDGSINTC